MKEKNGRLLSLDVLRGFDMSFIMGGEVVLICLASLFPGLEFIGGQMQHSQWDGFTFYDLIFPSQNLLTLCSAVFLNYCPRIIMRSAGGAAICLCAGVSFISFIGRKCS